MILRCCTRENTAPQGKPKLYFACHPQDLASCFPVITQAILALRDCAIFSCDSLEPMDPDLQEQLEEMQLVVVPVTTRLLTEACRAMEEISFALAQRIPVLPFLVEPELESLYAGKFGDLPCLPYQVREPASIPFSHRLRGWLEAVLPDRDADRVFKAFDASLYLSCQNRDQARQLTKILRERDFARDVSILYRDFLLPPQEEAELQAIEACDIYAIAVTPALLTGEQSGLDQEYAAVRAGQKPILAVTVSPTDREALQLRYPRMPHCVDPQGMGASLLRKLNRLEMKQKPRDPSHNYLMGLACLQGLGREIDRPLAVTLLTDAARAGCEDAIRKLSRMYALGDGVARDPRKALLCCRHLKALTEAATETGTNQLLACFPYLNALYDCAAASFAWAQPQEAIAAGREFLELAEPILPGWGDPMWTRKLLVIYGLMSGALSGTQPEQALSYDRKALELGKLLIRQEPGPDARRLCIDLREHLSRHFTVRKQYAQAEPLIRRSSFLRRELLEETGDPRDSRRLAQGLKRLSSLLQDRKDPVQAAQVLTQAMEVLTDPSPDTQWLLLSLCRSLGGLYRQIGDLQAAEDRLQQALALARQLYEQTQALAALYALARSCFTLGDFLLHAAPAERLPDARQYLSEAMDLYQDLLQKSDDPLYPEDLARLHRTMTLLALRENDRKAFRSHSSEAVRLTKDLARQTHSADRPAPIGVSITPEFLQLSGHPFTEDNYRHALAMLEDTEEPILIQARIFLLRNQAQDLQQAGRIREALGPIQEALRLGKQLLHDHPAPDLQQEIAAVYQVSSVTRAKKGDVAAARADLRCALTLYGPLYERDPGMRTVLARCCTQYVHSLAQADRTGAIFADAPQLMTYLSSLGTDHREIADACSQVSLRLAMAALREAPEQVTFLMEQSLRCARALAQMDPTFQLRLTQTLHQAALAWAPTDPQQAQDRFEEAAGSAKAAESIQARMEAGDLHADFARFWESQQDKDQALRWYGSALKVYEDIPEKDVSVLKAMAQIHLAMGQLYHRANEPAQALPCYESSVALRRSLLPQIPTEELDDFLRDLADNQNNMGLQYYKLRRYEEALRAYSLTVSMLEPLLSQFPAYIEHLAVSCCSMAWILAGTDYTSPECPTQKDKLSQGYRLCKKAQAIYRKLRIRHPQGEYRSGLRDTFLNLTAICRLRGRPLEAARYEKESRKYR